MIVQSLFSARQSICSIDSLLILHKFQKTLNVRVLLEISCFSHDFVVSSQLKKLRKWCEMQRFLTDILVFLHSIELQCWVSLLIIMRQLYRTTSNSYIWCDDDNSRWYFYDFLKWEREREFWYEFFNFVNVFCNDNQRLRIVCLLIKLREVFSHCVVRDYSFF